MKQRMICIPFMSLLPMKTNSNGIIQYIKSPIQVMEFSSFQTYLILMKRILCPELRLREERKNGNEKIMKRKLEGRVRKESCFHSVCYREFVDRCTNSMLNASHNSYHSSSQFVPFILTVCTIHP